MARLNESTVGTFDVQPFAADVFVADDDVDADALVISRGWVRGAVDARAIPVARTRARGTVDGTLAVHAHATGSSAGATGEALIAWSAFLGCDACSFDAVGHGLSVDVDGGYGDALAAAYDEGEGERRVPGARPYVTDGGVDCLRVARALGARRVLLTGDSLGGMYVASAAAGWSYEWGFKILACAPMVGFSSFAYGLKHDRWFARAMSLPAQLWLRVSEGKRKVPTLEDVRAFYARVCPGLCGGAHDGDAILARIRAKGVHFLAVNGADDPRNPITGVEEVYEKMLPLENLGTRPQCTIVARIGIEHEITGDMRAVVQRFFSNVLKNPIEPEAMTFDENEWNVIANETASLVRAGVRDKLKSWASGRGVDFALYLSEEEQLFSAAGVKDSTATSTSDSESVQAVTRLIDALKAQLAEKYVSPFEIARAAKQAEEDARKAAAEREWQGTMEAEEHAERERIETEEKRHAEEEERRGRVEEARRREEAERLAHAAAEKELAEKLLREKEEKDRLERARREEEKARRAAEEAERARKEKGLSKVRELLSKKAEAKKAERESARDRVHKKLSNNVTRSSSVSERLARLKISKEDSND